MRDVERLRRFLWAAALAAPLAAACGGSGGASAAKPGPSAGGKGGAAKAKPPVEDGRRGVMRQSPGECQRGEWCGPGAHAARFAPDVPKTLGCPTNVVDPEGTQLNLREADTRAARAAGEADTCCYDWTSRCYDHDVVEGRPLVDDVGALCVAPVGGATGWGPARARGGGRGAAVRVPAALGAALAAAWRRDAQLEHASVASFARHTLELLAVGAPAALVAEVQRAALDEVRHAEGAFALAARFAGAPVGPGQLPAQGPRGLDAAALARAVFTEGCVGESIAALAATRALVACRDARTARHLRRVARDEARHAALAWRTLAWLRGVAPGVVLSAAAPLAPSVDPAALPEPPADEAACWAAFGRLTPAQEAACVADAWRGVIAPLLAGTEARG